MARKELDNGYGDNALLRVRTGSLEKENQATKRPPTGCRRLPGIKNQRTNEETVHHPLGKEHEAHDWLRLCEIS